VGDGVLDLGVGILYPVRPDEGRAFDVVRVASNNVLVMAPPLSITDEDLAFIVETVKGSFERL